MLLFLFIFILLPFVGCFFIGLAVLPDFVLKEPITILGKFAFLISNVFSISQTYSVFIVSFGLSIVLIIPFRLLGGKEWIRLILLNEIK